MLRQLHVLVAASVPLDRSLCSLQQGAWAACMQRWRAGILMGQPLSYAMASKPGALRRYHLRIVRLGERLGRLEECLGYLADLEEKDHGLRQRLQAALLYPAFLLAMTVAMIFILPPTFLRGILQLLSNHGPLPWPTRLLVAWSDLLRSPFFYVAAGLMLWLAWRVWSRPLPENWRRRLWVGLDRVPGLGDMLRSVACLRFSMALSAGYQSGASVMESLRLAGSSCGHPLLEEKIPVITEAVIDGRNLARALAESHFFPRSFVATVEIAMETGSLDQLLESACQLLEWHLESRLEALVVLLEPLCLGFLGILTGFVVIATALPLTQLVTAL